MILTKSLLHTTDVYIKKLKEASIETTSDFLMLFPREYEDKSEVMTQFSLVNITEKQAIKCTIELLTSEMTRNKKLLIKAVLTDSDGINAEAVWFNQRMILSKFAQGDRVLIFGKAKYEYGRLSFPSCEIEHFSEKRQEIMPVYSDVNYIPGSWIREKMAYMKPFLDEIPDDIPDVIRKKKGLKLKSANIRDIHFPSSIVGFEGAKKELGYGELFRFQLVGVEKKNAARNASEGLAPEIVLDPDFIKEIIATLPFPLTNKQKIVLFQILKDMEQPHAMARLLQGDVGTGKTVVALIAAVHTIVLSRKTPIGMESMNGRDATLSDTTLTGGARGGSFGQGFLEYNRELTSYAKENRKEMNEPEKMFWYQVLHQDYFRLYHFRRQKPIGNYIVDFYSSELQLVIEIDGETHIGQAGYDEERKKFLEMQGIREIRFTNLEISENIEGAYERLIIWIQSNPPLSPLSGGLRRLQVAIMAPTEILARQHFAGNEVWLMQWGIRSDILVGSLTPRMKEDARERLKTGQTDIVFGTHALIQDSVQFANLGFVVVDEQHRFGVEQRKILEEYCSRSKIVPHRLNMSATPIPRTLALTIYGDQDVSVLDEYPLGRKPIHTRVIKEEQRIEMYRFIEEEVHQGRQVYWISPLVEESETLEVASAVEMQVTLSSIFPKLTIGLIHGKMSGKEKDRVMQEFYENKIHILSSTSVVEVGVNNPNATVMCIEAAERFGLSQLHQFRGRVGRGQDQSYCYLFTTKEYKTDRLRAMEQTGDGFELAEIDLELRGPGEVYGVRQSGVPDFHFADLRDVALISEIREDIEEWIEKKKKGVI